MMNTINTYPMYPSSPGSGSSSPQQQQQATSSTYMDLLSDDSYYTTTSPSVVTPTANAVYSEYMSSSAPTVATFPEIATTTSSNRSSGSNEEKVVMIPSNSVFIDQHNLYNNATVSTAVAPSPHTTNYTTTTTPSLSSSSSCLNNNQHYYQEDTGRDRNWQSSSYDNWGSTNDHHNNESYSSPYNNSGSGSHTNYDDGEEMAIASLQNNPGNNQQRFYKGKPVKPKNAHLPDSILAFKAERKRRTVIATCTGGAVGFVAFGLVLGPVGAVIGATSAYAAAKAVGKQRERKMTQHAILQQNYMSSSLSYGENSPATTTSSNNNVDPSATDIVQRDSSTPSYGVGSTISPYYSTQGRSLVPLDRAEMA